MRAAVFAGDGRVEVVDRPRPAAELHDDIVIKIQANGLCGSDLRAFATPPEMRYDVGVIVGHEFSGVVAEAGPGATLAVGGRVTVHPNIWCQRCYYCRTNRINLCDNFVHIGSMRDGGAAEYCVVPERMVYRLPDSLPVDRAALAEPLACVLNGTAQAAVAPGESVLVLGGGPIGLLYLMLFKAAGAFPVIVSEPTAERARWARELGADEVIDYRSADWPERVRDLTEGRGVDHVVETIGELAPSVRALGMEGEIAFVGLLARDDGLPAIDPQALWTKGLTLRAIAVGSRAQFEAMNRAIETNRITPVIDRVFAFGEAIDAYRYYERARPLGKVVIAHGE